MSSQEERSARARRLARTAKAHRRRSRRLPPAAKAERQEWQRLRKLLVS